MGLAGSLVTNAEIGTACRKPEFNVHFRTDYGISVLNGK